MARNLDVNGTALQKDDFVVLVYGSGSLGRVVGIGKRRVLVKLKGARKVHRFNSVRLRKIEPEHLI